MQLAANARVGQIVQGFLVVRYNAVHPENRIVPRRVEDLISVLFRLRSRIDSGQLYGGPYAGYDDTAYVITLRAMIRGVDKTQTAHSKATAVLNDMQILLLLRKLPRIEKQEGESLSKQLAALYNQEAAERDLGVLGHTLLGLCNYYVRQVPIKGDKLRRLHNQFRTAAAACDQAETLADQRRVVSELAELLQRKLRPYIPPEGKERFNMVIERIWSWVTEYLLRDPDLWSWDQFLSDEA